MPYELKQQAELAKLNISEVCRTALIVELDKLSGKAFEREAERLIRKEKEIREAVDEANECATLYLDWKKREGENRDLARQAYKLSTGIKSWKRALLEADAKRLKFVIEKFDELKKTVESAPSTVQEKKVVGK